jgi:hypothetical protein
MHPKKLALPVAAALLALAAAAGAATPAATPLGWYSGGACDDAEAQNPGAPGGLPVRRGRARLRERRRRRLG